MYSIRFRHMLIDPTRRSLKEQTPINSGCNFPSESYFSTFAGIELEVGENLSGKTCFHDITLHSAG